MIAYLGVDWAANAAETAIAVGSARPRKFRRVGRSDQGVQEVVNKAASLPDVDEVRVIIESGAPGWLELFHAAEARVFVVDAGQSKAFAASLRSSGAKSDASDAAMMVLLGQSPAHAEREWTPRSALVEAQDQLVDEQFSRSKRLGSAQQRLRAHLREYLLDLEDGIPDLDREWVWRLLRAVPTRLHASRLTLAEFEELMAGSGAHRPTRERMWKCVQKAGRRPEDEVLANALAVRVKSMVDDVQHLAGQKAQIDAELDALTKDLDLRKTLESVKGIGSTLSQHLMAVGFEIDAVPTDRDEVAVRMGAAPVWIGTGDRKDGKGKKGFVKMRRASKTLARRTTYLLGRLASQNLAWAKAQYADARRRGKNAATAYRIVARSLLRILSAVIRNNEPYDEERYIRRLIGHGVPWAADLLPESPAAA